MRVGLFTDTYMPQINGVATSVRMLKEYMEKRGHEVFVFTTTDPHSPDGERGVFRLPSIPFVSERRVGMFYHPMYAKIVRQLRLDIIHTHTEFSLGIFGRGMAKALNIPLIHTMHTKYEDYTHYIVKLNALNPMAKSVAKKISVSFCNSADGVIAPTNKVRDMLYRYGVQKEISTVPTGVELNKFQKYDKNAAIGIRNELGLGSSEKVILYIGRISEEKNIDEIFISLKDYLNKNRNVRFVLVGDGPVRSKLELLAHELDISEETVFVGEKPWDDIGRYYQLGDVFVSASQSETQGLTYIEALAAGLPVVAKKDPCLEGVVRDGINGYTFNNHAEFIDQLVMVLSNDGHRSELAAGAKSTSELFSAPGYAEAVETVYSKTLYRMSAIYAC